ncbi:hypothetical protein BJV78DRAFT_589997 [Lactifluus subvellereus]|nr:hypothetical protein BJV78DRAFT_589997 [Lactifluus subvellereus]
MPPVLCPECDRQCGRLQELKRHILSFHLPCWIYCPYGPCAWRGHREEDFKAHWDEHECGPKPPQEQHMIYDKNLVLDLILVRRQPVEAVVRYVLDFVFEKALELGTAEEWADPWG